MALRVSDPLCVCCAAAKLPQGTGTQWWEQKVERAQDEMVEEGVRAAITGGRSAGEPTQETGDKEKARS